MCVNPAYNRLFWGRVFAANLGYGLTKQTYNNQDKHKKRKDNTRNPKTPPNPTT